MQHSLRLTGDAEAAQMPGSQRERPGCHHRLTRCLPWGKRRKGARHLSMGCRGWGRRRAKRGTLATGTRSPTDLTCSWPSPSASLIGVHLGRHLPPRTAGAPVSVGRLARST
ncbi:unspecified product [Leishmania tarentolae]|uniref:Unspecified product n=1 Tax=Leishmania tarentolae TaxID=5689 RepID=A0A640KRZ2_LEITA|nr:unspecified product [Leishmania tarentolae]